MGWPFRLSSITADPVFQSPHGRRAASFWSRWVCTMSAAPPQHVRFWPLADMPLALKNVRSGVKRTWRLHCKTSDSRTKAEIIVEKLRSNLRGGVGNSIIVWCSGADKYPRLKELMLQVPVQKHSIALPILTAALAAGIFAADTATHLDIAVPVLYVAVVLISVQFCERRGVLFVAAGCIALTLFSSALTGTD